jgi:hypothetical protein
MPEVEQRRSTCREQLPEKAMTDKLTEREELELEAAVLRRLLRHFDEHKEVQNIELMTLAGFCRNCLSKWFVEAAKERGLDVDLDNAREKIYGMPYSEWKERYQPPATEEQLARLAVVEKAKAAKAKAGK